MKAAQNGEDSGGEGEKNKVATSWERKREGGKKNESICMCGCRGVRTGCRTVKCMCSGQRGRNKEMNKCMQRVVGECM